MTRILHLLIILGSSSFLFAQDSKTGEIQGTVRDQDGTSMPGVRVELSDTKKRAISDNDGKFKLTGVQAGKYLLQATSISYKMTTQEINLKPGEQLQVEIEMEADFYDMPQINILGYRNKENGIFKSVPGSLTYIDKKEIDMVNPINSNEVLRRSTGVHVVEEEGAGMRMNMAVRGLDAARSRSTLILEDGIPLALAPYGEPEMYYAPAMEKMQGVEILKGSGSIMYGPQTIGGVVNFITKDPPLKSAGTVNIKGGQAGFFSGLLSYGNTVGKAGFQVNYLHKRADNMGVSMFRLHDLSSKFKFKISDRSSLGVKMGIYKEVSNSTYVGMTQSMFDSGNYDFEVIAPDDRLRLSRYNISASHKYDISDNTKLTSTVFAYTTTRNWQRQDFTYNSFDASGNLNPKPARYSGITHGDESIENGAIYMLNSSGNRNRTYEIAGAESRVNSSYNIGSMENEFTGGIRFLHEQALEQRINGEKLDAPSGEIMNDEIRTGRGVSAYLHNRFNITSKFSLTTGVRIEMFNDNRQIRRSVYEINGSNEVRDTSITASNSLTEVIPGVGFNFQPLEKISIFGGAHRGFAPPRTKDAISNVGEVHELDAEKSWNYELGLRGNTEKGIRYEVTGFYMDFSNQVIPVAEHAGGIGAGITNGGATVHAGIEGGLFLDLAKIIKNKKWSFYYDVNITYVQAHFNSDRWMEDNNEAVNVNGNRTPYTPEWLVSSALTYEHKDGYAARISMTYITEQYTDPFNTVTPHNNGREGLIPAYKLIDASIFIPIKQWNTTFNISVKNLLNERFIASRRPQGIMMGVHRMVTAGFIVDF